jgi:murein DD-endopeptidase MepM/ murein hydrolase activator NlpD
MPGIFRVNAPKSCLIRAAVLALFSAMPLLASAQESYPAIRVPQTGDYIYDQLSDSIEHFHESEKAGQISEDLSIYSYTLPADVDIFSIAAAFSLPYDAIATLNRLGNAETIGKGTRLLIPSQPGIFVPLSPANDLELLMKSLWRESTGLHYQVRALVDGRNVDFAFYPGAGFHPAERTFFLVAGFRFPLPRGVITSNFGERVDPFGSRSIKFHSGIDIGAPFGTTVFAARSGRVESTGWSDTYGNYIVIIHDSSWETLYGHLSKILVSKRQAVNVGETIGLVGSTGQSTGPHLHFETRRRGVATDPSPLMTSRP